MVLSSPTSLTTDKHARRPPAVALAPVTNLLDFLNSVPPHLTALLINLSPYISAIRYAAEVTSWKAPSWYESWLALALWWALCLFLDAALRYLVPLIVLYSIFHLKRREPPPKPSQPPVTPPLVTEHAIQSTISDLNTIQCLIPKLPSPPRYPLPTLLRLTVILYIPYLFLTHYFLLRTILAVVGSIIFTWRAPWACVLRSSVWSSAWFRWATYYIWSKLSGIPLPPRAYSQNHLTTAAPSPGTSLRFLFTIYENQRWWVGLDWTAALLPGERPSWCSANQQAISPPNAFTLPDETIIYLPSPNGKGRIQRTAQWRWEEPEWKVFVKKDGINGVPNRVEKPFPSTREDSSTLGAHATSSANKLIKAAGKIKDAPSNDMGSVEPEGHDHDDSENEEAQVTDTDGWIYGDNKWEGQGAKGGMGKYTRYRRWTRVAIVEETVDVVGEGDLGIQRYRTFTAPEASPSLSPHEDKTSSPQGQPMERVGSPLRQRLKKLSTKPTA